MLEVIAAASFVALNRANGTTSIKRAPAEADALWHLLILV